MPEESTDHKEPIAQESKPFMVELWDSIFTPGTLPALVKATHASFLTLITIFAVLVFISDSRLRFHFVNLLLISVLFYGVVIWFVSELRRIEDKEK